MSTLDNLLRPVAHLLNRNIADSMQARELCAGLSGRVIEVRLRDTSLAASFIVSDDRVDIQASPGHDPDAFVQASVAGFVRLASGNGEDAIRDGAVQLSGDAETAQAFQALLMAARPELEEELSNIVGDTAAFRAGEFGRSIREWSQSARATMGANIREYLQEESDGLPTRIEVDRFKADVSTLRDDVDRLEARLKRLGDNDT